MEYPHGHHHHRRRQEEEEEEEEGGYRRPQPFGGEYEAPPPPFFGGSEHLPPSYGRPPSFYGESEPPPPPPEAYHSHTSPFYGGDPESYPHPPPPPPFSNSPPPDDTPEEGFFHHRPHLPQFMSGIVHHSHEKAEQVAEKPSVKMYCKAETNYSLTVREGKVILAPSDPSDPFQHWIKDLKFSTKVKDEEGFPSFALVNKATGLAMKHSVGATHPVQLVPYNPDVLDESVLWTESRDLGDSYRAIRMVNNIRLNVDAFNGDKNHGGVRDGTTIVLWEWKKGDNQRWKIVPY